MTVATVGPDVGQAFHEFGELVGELIKLVALLRFGSLSEGTTVRASVHGSELFAQRH